MDTVKNHRVRVAAIRREEMQDRLLLSAIALASEKSIHEISIEEIIEHAEVSRGTFYKYFNTVPQLFAVLAKKISNEFIIAFDNIIPNIPIGDISDFNFSLINPIINSSSIIKKKLCYWNENGIEDYDLWLRLKKLNHKFFNFKEILVKHRIHNNSAFNSKGNNNKVNKLLISHGFESRQENKNKSLQIYFPEVNKINMNIL